jgi:hypothetical protein
VFLLAKSFGKSVLFAAWVRWSLMSGSGRECIERIADWIAGKA